MKKALVVIVFFIALSCTKSNSFVETNRVYVAGTAQNGTQTVAKYWKNGQAVILSDGDLFANSSGIAVSGSDIYVSGSISYTSSGSTAAYWKNGQQVTLADGNYITWTTGIQVSGGDIYLAGNELGFNQRGVYWKNGEAVRLTTDTLQNSYASGIAVSGNDLYIAASIQTYPVQSNNIFGVYLKNDQAITLAGNDNTAGENHFTSGGSVVVSDGNAYVAGLTTNGVISIPTFWKNGKPTLLSNENTVINTNLPILIAVAGNDVYVAATVHKPSYNNTPANNIVVYWKNGQLIYITNGSHDAYTTGISVLGNDVYISGNESNGLHSIAKYWRNGQTVNLRNGNNDEYTTGIVVLPE